MSFKVFAATLFQRPIRTEFFSQMNLWQVICYLPVDYFFSTPFWIRQFRGRNSPDGAWTKVWLIEVAVAYSELRSHGDGKKADFDTKIDWKRRKISTKRQREEQKQKSDLNSVNKKCRKAENERVQISVDCEPECVETQPCMTLGRKTQ